ncbi:MAG: bifunctional hydroxymethylpyrimidine kinase/phosphomethylpyrimidine kinase [Zetaproteobacteria bacterium CG1_02_53_45]|nr:MAG: bifunctional hydroxymethylpyrimidine kinase/phosphomethylpyrimidine kinase [Zetaproteobacteria bacterium CG1_02_53_45]
MSPLTRPICLSVGGSDSCGGAGIQADLRVFEARHVQGLSATTALTAQNPVTISRIEAVSLAQLDAELHTLFDYYDISVVKTGMLVDAEHVALISALLQQRHRGLLVVDPVMISSSGKPLLDAGGVDALKHALLPLATLMTPNLDEAAALLGEAVAHPVDAAKKLVDQFGCAVLLKGGHGDGDALLDLLCDRDGNIVEFSHARQPWSVDQSHGTGCRLAAAVAAALASGDSLAPAIEKSVHFLQVS